MTMTSYIVGYLGIGTRHFIRAQSDEAQGGIDPLIVFYTVNLNRKSPHFLHWRNEGREGN